MIETVLREAGAPVDAAINFQNPEEAGVVGKYLTNNGLYLFWASDDNGVDLTVAAYPGDTFFPGADGEEHIKDGIIDRLSIGWLGAKLGSEIGLPENPVNFPAFRQFLSRAHAGMTDGDIIREFWEAFAAST